MEFMFHLLIKKDFESFLVLTLKECFKTEGFIDSYIDYYSHRTAEEGQSSRSQRNPLEIWKHVGSALKKIRDI